jgi:hypothetical protein
VEDYLPLNIEQYPTVPFDDSDSEVAKFLLHKLNHNQVIGEASACACRVIYQLSRIPQSATSGRAGGLE